MQPLMLLVMFVNGTVVRLSEREDRGVTLHVSQGFSHKKQFPFAKSYSDLRFVLAPFPCQGSNGVRLMARIFSSLEEIRDLLVSGPYAKRTDFFWLIGDPSESSTECFQWKTSRIEPMDLSTLLTVTPRRSFLTFLEALYPLKYQYQAQRVQDSCMDEQGSF